MKSSSMPFAKMHASANDFVVIDNRSKVVSEKASSLAIRLCERKTGIGADGMLLLENPSGIKADFRMRIFNPDGSEAEMCGNGARCIALFAFAKGVAPERMRIETKAKPVSAEIKGERVRLSLSSPKKPGMDFPVKVKGRNIKVSYINTGVPHTVIFVHGLKEVDVDGIGSAIRHHGKFAPAGTNVDFVSVEDERSVSIRTYERGVEGETLACGTGSVASAIVAGIKGYVAPPVNVKTRGGEVLKVSYRIEKDGIKDVYLEGGAKIVYEGRIGRD